VPDHARPPGSTERTRRRVRQTYPTPPVAVVALAAVALLVSSCGAETPAPPSPATSTSAASTTGLPADRVGQAHRAALGLIAVGELGAEKGSTTAMRSLARRTAADGRALDQQIRELATADGLVLTDDVDADTQGVLADLGTRSGRDFDEAWLAAVADLIGQGRQGADGLLGSAQAGSVARNLDSRFDALTTALAHALGKPGPAATPT
jgi:predicted outer membrane protein